MKAQSMARRWRVGGGLVVAIGSVVFGCGNGFPKPSPTLAGGGESGGDSGGESGASFSGEAGRALGIGGSLGQGTLFDSVEVQATEFHTCVRLTDGRVKCWGQNGGMLGLGDGDSRGDQPGQMGTHLPAVELGTQAVARQLSATANVACVLLEDGAVKCWGNNSSGECGQGNTVQLGLGPEQMGEHLPPIELGSHGPVARVVTADFSACALLQSGQVVCWGDNTHGQLGVGDRENRGDDPGEMGDALKLVELGEGRTVLELSGGAGHFCALLDDHRIKCWGLNSAGQLGLGDADNRGDEPGEMGDALPAVELGSPSLVRSVAAGHHYSCAILEDRRVQCWGDNSFGQLGNGDGTYDAKGDGPSELGHALLPVMLPAAFEADKLALGEMHVCALSTNRELLCWGTNDSGQLGTGDTEPHSVEPATLGATLEPLNLGPGLMVDVDAGFRHTCVAFAEGGVKCWGGNPFGGLGYGDTEARGDEPGEMGKALPFVELD